MKIGDNIERDREWCNEWCRDLHILTDVHERWLGPLPSSVTLSKMVTISDPWFPCRQTGTIILYIIPPPGKAILHGLIPASTGSCGQGSHHTCFTMVFRLASCPPHYELLDRQRSRVSLLTMKTMTRLVTSTGISIRTPR